MTIDKLIYALVAVIVVGSVGSIALGVATTAGFAVSTVLFLVWIVAFYAAFMGA